MAWSSKFFLDVLSDNPLAFLQVNHCVWNHFSEPKTPWKHIPDSFITNVESPNDIAGGIWRCVHCLDHIHEPPPLKLSQMKDHLIVVYDIMLSPEFNGSHDLTDITSMTLKKIETIIKIMGSTCRRHLDGN